MNGMEVSEEEIIQKAKKGDTEAFSFLVNKYEPKISRYLSKFLYDVEDVQDLVQDVFIKAYVNIQSFDSSQSFSPWVYRIAHNEAINFLKKKKPTSFSLFDVDILFPHPVAKETADSETEKEMQMQMLNKVLGDIDTKYREILLLYFFEDMSYKDISRTLQIPISSVGVRIQRGKKQVEKIIQEKNYL
jgi:RNA polymerase sigma-70 factor (ECF subfamily)